jgi:hypothetical protein
MIDSTRYPICANDPHGGTLRSMAVFALLMLLVLAGPLAYFYGVDSRDTRR